MLTQDNKYFIECIYEHPSMNTSKSNDDYIQNKSYLVKIESSGFLELYSIISANKMMIMMMEYSFEKFLL